jgi:hypothetical protein
MVVPMRRLPIAFLFSIIVVAVASGGSLRRNQNAPDIQKHTGTPQQQQRDLSLFKSIKEDISGSSAKSEAEKETSIPKEQEWEFDIDDDFATNGLNTFTNFGRPSDGTYGLNTVEEGLFLADSLTARMIAIAGHEVIYSNGQRSAEKFHPRSDGGDVFVDPRPDNPGGYIFVSNSEIVDGGGVGAITFNSDGDVIDYRMLLQQTTMNCNGGRYGDHCSCLCSQIPSNH